MLIVVGPLFVWWKCWASCFIWLSLFGAIVIILLIKFGWMTGWIELTWEETVVVLTGCILVVCCVIWMVLFVNGLWLSFLIYLEI